MYHNEAEDKKIRFKCPIEQSTIVGKCPVASCIWNADGTCSYNIDATEIDVGGLKGLTLEEALLETRRAKLNIIKALVLDRYVEFVRMEFTEKRSLNKRLVKDKKLAEYRKGSKLDTEVFRLSAYQFCMACRSSVFAKFIDRNPPLAKYSLVMLLGLRENTLEEVRRRYRKVKNRKGKSTTKTQSKVK